MNPLSIFITIVLIILVFMFLRYMFTDPYTLQGINDGKTMTTIEPSSLATNGTNTPSSNFAYSVWFYVNDWRYRYGEPKVIFGRMGSTTPSEGGSVDNVPGADPCPLVLLAPVQNNIQVSISCFPGTDVPSNRVTPGNTIVHTCSVGNVPIQKWVNLVVSVYGRSMDIYIDGKLVRTCLLPGVASINPNAKIYVTPMGGFDGWTSNFQYYPNSLNPQDVWNIYAKGYRQGMFSNLFSSYDVQISLIENGTTQSTITI
jgi:hypothetical protein